MEEDKPKRNIKPGVFSSINQAVTNTNALEIREEQLIKEQTAVLTDIKSAVENGIVIKEKKGKEDSRTKENEEKQYKSRALMFFHDVIDKLNDIDDSSGMGILKLILFTVASLMVNAAIRIYKAIKFFGTILNNFWKMATKGIRSLFDGTFLKTRLGKSLLKVVDEIKFVFNYIAESKVGKTVTKVMNSIKNLFDYFKLLLSGVGDIFNGMKLKFLKVVKAIKDEINTARFLYEKFDDAIINTSKKIGKIIDNVSDIFKGIKLKFLRVARVIKDEISLIRFIFDEVISGFGKIIKPLKSFLGSGSKIIDVMKGLPKFFSGIGTFLAPLKNTFGYIGRLLKAIPMVGKFLKVLPFVGTILSIVDGIIGFFNAGKYFDKKEGEAVSITERISAIIGAIFSGLTFGLLGNAKEWANKVKDTITTITMVFTDFPLVWDTATRLIKEMFIGIFDSVKNAFSFAYTYLSDMTTSIFDWGKNIISSIFTFIMKAFGAEDEFIGKVKDVFIDTFNKIIDILKSPFEALINFIGDKLKFLNNLNPFSNKNNKPTNTNTKPEVLNTFSGGMGVYSAYNTNKAKLIANKPISEDINKSKEIPVLKSEKVTISETKAIPEESSIILDKGMTEIEKMKVFMDFLNNDFSSVMANKIGQVMKSGTVPLKPSKVVIQ